MFLLSWLRVWWWNRRHPLPQTLVSHIHYWDVCRQYGYRYRICLNGCDQRKAC